MDYRLIYKNGYKYFESNKPKRKYVNIKSITKLLVILVILDLYHKKVIDIKTKLPYIKNPNIRIVDILNHTSGLDNEWSKREKNRWIPSNLQKKYYKSKDIYNYAINLKPRYRLSSYHYNNFAYDILGKIIHDKTGMYVDEYLNKNILKDIKYTWFTINGLPVCSYGIGMYASHLTKLLKRIHKFALKVKFIDFAKKYGKYPLKLHISKSHTFYGHSGSGGQFLFMNKSFIVCRFAYGDPDELEEKDQMTNEDFSKWLICELHQ